MRPMRARVVSEMVLHGGPVDFRQLCAFAVPDTTRTLLLDLDRTVHFQRNMGELLGWEISAYRAYGPEALAALEPRRRPGRFLLEWSRPGGLLRYLTVGLGMWALPGLHYMWWGKLSARYSLLRRLAYRALGPDPTREAQIVPQTALMHRMADVPLGTLRDLAAKVWRRHVGDQVILREDLAWLRRRCPALRVVLTSASPQPMVEVAGAELGVDDVVFSSVEEHAGWLGAPPRRQAMSMPSPAPRRICSPGGLRMNAGTAKVAEIGRRFPDALGSADTVGVTDTGYGEDFCWASHFGRVIDVNSPTPFSPIVLATSPLEAIHSATLLTSAERRARDSGSPWRDPRRHREPHREAVRFEREVLEAALAEQTARVDQLLAEAEAASRQCAPGVERATAALELLGADCAAAVDDYNTAGEGARGAALARVETIDRASACARHRLALALRPLSATARALADELAGARARVEQLALRRPSADTRPRAAPTA